MTDRPLYSEDAKDALIDEYGDEQTAIRIAATEMDGANEDSRGNIDAVQTQCNNLEYDETLKDSEGRKEGEKKTRAELKEFLKQESLDNVDDWIKREEERRGLRAM